MTFRPRLNGLESEAERRPAMAVTQASQDDAGDWLSLRRALWPHASDDEHRADIAKMLGSDERAACFLARAEDGAAAGFAEVTMRRDYVNGCSTSPVGFLEGLFVVPTARRRGTARTLVAAAEAWAASRGSSEFASDVRIENLESQKVHAALGFSQTERVIYFHKTLAPRKGAVS
jgi:aminoglycoside 6'-N-acetyltransferase I